jgi:small subunit ribosomal protein S4
METKTAPKWLEVDKANASAKAIALPSREDVDFPFEEHLIVELYSK